MNVVEYLGEYCIFGGQSWQCSTTRMSVELVIVLLAVLEHDRSLCVIVAAVNY